MTDVQAFAGAPAPFQVSGFELAGDLGPTRDRQIVAAALGGGVRPWQWVQVPLEGGRGYFEVASDYLALGNESNWTRVPIGGPAAQVIYQFAFGDPECRMLEIQCIASRIQSVYR